MKRTVSAGIMLLLALGALSETARPDDDIGCSWDASATGISPALGDFSGTTGSVKQSDEDSPPLNIDAVVQDLDPQPRAPWLVIRLRNYDDMKRVSDPGFISEINLAIPGVPTGVTGPFNRVWGNFRAGPQTFDGNADYLRRNVIGLPEGTGIGHLLTTNVHLSRNDGIRVIGSFEARFLNPEAFRKLDILEQHPPGVGVHAIANATVNVTGTFSILNDGSCSGGFRRPGR